jgi:hypothetical protein
MCTEVDLGTTCERTGLGEVLGRVWGWMLPRLEGWG